MMGRKPHIHFPGAFYHVINGGNQRQEIYWDEADFERMLEKFKEATRSHQRAHRRHLQDAQQTILLKRLLLGT
jgi:hypothetical protein